MRLKPPQRAELGLPIKKGTRLRSGPALMNLALLRSVGPRLLSGDSNDQRLLARMEWLAANPTSALVLIQARL